MREELKKFARGAKSNLLKSTPYCVIYTRVSTKEQAEGNYSLPTQRKLCEDYCNRHGLIIEGIFGGTYESAKNDERREFKRMLRFIQTHSTKVSHVVVCYPDRFSRSGANAIYIAAELRKNGVLIDTVHQNTDTSNASGEMMQNMQFIMSSYDNQLRKERCVSGMIEKMRRGHWIGGLPLGYRIDKGAEGYEQKIVFTDDAPMVKKAFLLKADQQLSNIQISKKLAAIGYKISDKKLSKILRNPFYCGKITNGMLGDEVLEGKHPALITEEVFLAANNALAKNPQNYKANAENEALPLRRNLICDHCGTNMTGYLVKKKGIYYYKCNTKGCGNNRSAGRLHEQFETFLGTYTMDPKYISLLQKQLLYTYEYVTKSSSDNTALIRKSITELKGKITQLEEKFILDEIERPLYEKFKAKYESELAGMEEQLNGGRHVLSNPEKFVTTATEICSNLNKMWASGSLEQRRKIQQVVFPEGIRYDRQKDDYRTTKVNTVFALLADQSRVLAEGKKKRSNFLVASPALVASARIELTSKV